MKEYHKRHTLAAMKEIAYRALRPRKETYEQYDRLTKRGKWAKPTEK